MKITFVLKRFVAGLILLSGLYFSHPVFPQTSASFSFSYSEELTGGPLSGRLLLLVSQDTATDPDLITVPFTLDHNRMIIHGDIRTKDGNRRNVRIWVDTGNPDFFLSPELASDLGIPLPPDSLIPDHGFLEVPFPGELRIRGRKLPTASISCYVVMKRQYFFTATHCDLNLPSTVLMQYDIQFDYPARKLSLSPSGKGAFRGLPVNALVHPVTGIVQITATMDEDSLSFALDNGASYSFGSTELLEKLRSKHPEVPVCQGAAGAANIWGMPLEPSTYLIRIPELSWGTHQLSGLGMAIPPDFTEDGQGMMDWYSRKTVRPVDGFLGPNAYLQFCLGIDYNQQLVYLSDAGKKMKHDLDMVGLILAPEPDSSWVIIGSTTIDGKSLVEEVHPGDILVEINGIPVKGKTMGVIVDALRGEPGELKTLQIKRDGTIREITDVQVKRIL